MPLTTHKFREGPAMLHDREFHEKNLPGWASCLLRLLFLVPINRQARCAKSERWLPFTRYKEPDQKITTRKSEQCDDHGVRGIVSTTRRVARRCAGRSQNTSGWCQLPRVPCGQKVDTLASTARNTSGKLTASAGKRLPGTATKVTAPSGTVRSVWQ